MQTNIPIFRAAYSDRTALLMATLSRLVYRFPPFDCAPGPCSSVPDAFTAIGFDRITYFHNDLVDGWALIVENEDLAAIAFRGTASLQNWRTNFQASLITPANVQGDLKVHEGFYSAFEKLHDGTQGIRASVAQIVQMTKGRKPFYITGHSLGGALAQIATAVLACDQIAACYTFGSPRIGNRHFDLWVKPPSYRIANYADIVPQIPIYVPFLYPYRHSGEPRYLPDKVAGSPYRYEPAFAARIWQWLVALNYLWRAGKILGIDEHNIAHYEAKLAAIEANRQRSL